VGSEAILTLLPLSPSPQKPLVGGKAHLDHLARLGTEAGNIALNALSHLVPAPSSVGITLLSCGPSTFLSVLWIFIHLMPTPSVYQYIYQICLFVD
jgi:hypothetical protein